MASVNKVKIKTDIYDISPSPNGTLDTTTTNNKFESSDSAQGSATAWTSVDQLSATETNKSIFTKITQMIKNVRFLYNIIGTGFSTGSTVKNQIDSKAPSNHTHNSVKDIGDNSNTVFAYSKAGMNYADYTWLAGWNGYELRCVHKNQFATASHTHDDRYYTESEINSKLDGKLSTSGGKITGKITKSTSGSWIGDRDRACVSSDYPGDSSYGAVAAMATKNGYWTIGNLGGDEKLIFNYSTDTNYNAGKNETTQVYLPNQAGTIITSATIGSQSVDHANSSNSANYATNAGSANGVTPEWSGSVDLNSSSWLAAWSSDGKKIKAMSTGNFATAGHTHSSVDGVKDYNDGNRTIKIGFAGDGLNTSNLNYIAGYTENGTKIKDVSKDVLKQWLGSTSATVDGTTVVFG